MKKVLVAALSISLVAGFSFSSVSEAKTKIITYKNCSALNKVYKGGVSISASTKNKGGNTRFKPYANKALYLANKKSDRDKDNIACEK